MNKRKIFTVAIALCLVAAMACGTLAYFTAHKSLTNYFYVSNVTPGDPDEPVDPDDVFSIKLYETDHFTGEETEDGMEYDGIAPGDVLHKDPTVRNTGAYSAYIRVNVTLTKAAKWMEACEKYEIKKLDSIFKGYNESEWTRYDEPVYDEEADTLTYTFYHNEAVAPEGEIRLFNEVSIPSDFTQVEMAAINGFTLEISADAIQSQNTGGNAYQALALLEQEAPQPETTTAAA